MAITLSGEFTSPRTPDEVYDFLCDANKFGPLLPDFESMSVEDATHFTLRVRVAVGNIRGMAEIKMELSQAVRPIRAQYQGRGIAVGSQIAISVGFDLSPLAEGTRIAWQGEASVFGKLALLAGGMLEPVSRKNIHKLMDGLQSSLTSPPAEAMAQPAPSEAVPSAPAEQPMQAPQELPSAAEQGTPAEQLGSPSQRNCRD
ncbi:MAG: SRPBCC domain-containing protein [Candidatus Korobacteraceae bacterium]